MFLTADELTTVKNILQNYFPNHTVWAFGSRVHGENLKKFSDLDLAIISKQPIEEIKLADIQESFSNSNLSFRVDIVDWAVTQDHFRKIIQSQHETI